MTLQLGDVQTTALIPVAIKLAEKELWISLFGSLGLLLCGYITEFIVIAGILSGKFGLKKRFLLFMYLGYAIVYALVILIVKISGITGLRGGLESLFETTFFLPAFFAWKKKITGEKA